MPQLRLQDEPVELDAGLWRLWLEKEPEPGLAMRCRIDPKKPVRWKELDKLKSLTELQYQGGDEAVVAYVARRKLRTFWWLHHGQKRIDVTKSRLTELAVDVPGPLTIAIPKTLTTLRLLNAKTLGKVRIQTDDDGERLAIWIWTPKTPLAAPVGVPRLSTLSIGPVSTADAKAVRTLSGRLEIYGVPSGVAVKNLKALTRLKELSLQNAYHTDFSVLPRIPQIDIDGIRANDAAALRARDFPQISLRGVRTEAWLAKNADNPFREWKAKAGTTAFRAWKKAAGAKGDPEKILREFVDSLNALDLDTIMREEADGAFGTLAERLGVPLEKAYRWLDSWRDF